jgi:hypothetical protein
MSRRPLSVSAACRFVLGAALVTLAACSGGDSAGPSGPRTPPPPTTGALSIELAGLPAGVAPAVRLIGPSGERPVLGSGTISDLPPGDYSVAAAPVTASMGGFAPDSASRAIAVRVGTTGTLRVVYSITTGTVAIVAAGLPAGAAPRFALRSAAQPGVERQLGDTATITHLSPGAYTLRVLASRSDSGTWAPSLDSLPLTITASSEPVRIPVNYSALPVRLSIAVAGLPGNAEASMLLRGPGVARAVVQSLRLDSLARGTYELEAGTVRASGFTWLPDSTRRAVTLRAGDSANVAVQYGVTTGALAIAVSGIPEGFPASVRVNGPDNFTRVVSGTQTLTDIAPGDYDVQADTVRLGSGRYDPVTPAQRVRVTASITAAPATVAYRAAPGRLLVSILNVPAGATPSVTVTATNGWTRTLSASADLGDVPAGVLRLTAAAFTSGGDVWRATSPTFEVTVQPGGTSTASVPYSIATGRLQLVPAGLPAGAAPSVTITGPGSFARAVDLSTPVTLTSLEPGTYALSASTFVNQATTFAPTTPTQSVVVVRGATAATTITWATQTALNNLVLESAYITQAVQRMDGSVPLVANRDGMLRVFVRAAQGNSWRPQVRVRLYDGVQLVQTSTLEAQEASVRTTLDEGTLTASWNVAVPAALMRTTLRVLADVDPGSTIAESSETDNIWPRSGNPQAIDVRTVPTLPIRFVSVVNAGRTGGVTTGNVEQFMASARRLFPLGTVNVSVRSTPYTSTTPQLDANDNNNAWETILTEINALRAVEGPSNSYYYGVVRVAYNSGIAGLGYVPGRAAIGWDYLPSGDAVAAHELGHNFGRGHAPCGVSGDPGYPHAGGLIGVFGFNVGSMLVVPPTRADLMGYCNSVWISDWTWTNVMQYRQLAGSLVSEAVTHTPPHGAHLQSTDRVMLVWGRATPERIVVEPAFAFAGDPTIGAVSRGAYRVEARDASDALLFSHRFDGEAVDHARSNGTQHFAVTVPVDAETEARIASLTVTRVEDGRTARTGGMARNGTGETDVDAVRESAGRMQLRYDAGRTRMALVRDRVTGEILSFVRSPGAEFRAPRSNVEVLLSDGVRTRAARVRVVNPN